MEGSRVLLSMNGYHNHIISISPPFPPFKFSHFHRPSTSSTTTTTTYSSTSLITFVYRQNNNNDNKLTKKPSSSSSNAPRKRVPAGSRSSGREAAVSDILHSPHLPSALSRSGVILKASELNMILRSFGKSSRWNDLSQLFKWMETNGKINIASYSTYIKLLAEGNKASSALYTYQNINDESLRYNGSICNSVLNCLVKSNNFDQAISLFEQMKQNGLQPDVVTYSTLLAGCMKVEYGFMKALELVKELEEYGIQMDSVIYGTLIAVCASKSQCENAKMFFGRMKAEGHSPNMYHYSSLLNAFSVNGDYHKADELVLEMKAAGLVPNKVVLTTLLKVYVRGGLFEKSRSLLSKLETMGYAGDEMPYCLLMDGLSKSGKVDEAKLIFDEMHMKQVRSDGYSHSIMISAFCRAGRLEEGRELARNYEAMYNNYDLVILNVMLCAYCRAGDMESVMQTMRKMDKLAIDPDQYTFRILIKYFCKEKLYLLAYRTLLDMSGKGYEVEEEILLSLIHDLGTAGAHVEAFSVYNILRSSKTEMDSTIHEKMLHILVTGQFWEDAFGVVKDNAKLISPEAVKKFLTALMKSDNENLLNDALETIHNCGYNIDQDLFHQAISYYISQPTKKELLLELLQWMPNHGYAVDSITRNLILKNSKLYGHQVIAEVLSKHQVMAKTLRPCKENDGN